MTLEAPLLPMGDFGLGRNKFYANEHTVMEGETLASISTRYFGNDAKADDIYQANKAKIPDKTKLAPGTRIKIPGVSP